VLDGWPGRVVDDTVRRPMVKLRHRSERLVNRADPSAIKPYTLTLNVVLPPSVRLS
jgi:hypothetical protein